MSLLSSRVLLSPLLRLKLPARLSSSKPVVISALTKLVWSKVSSNNINPLEKSKKSTGMSSLVCPSELLLLLVLVNSLRKKPSRWLLGLLVSGETLKSPMFTRTGLVVSFKVLSSRNLSTRLIPSEPSSPAKSLSPKLVISLLVQLTPMMEVSQDSMRASIFLILCLLLWLLLLFLHCSLIRFSKEIPTWTVESSDRSMSVVQLRNA